MIIFRNRAEAAKQLVHKLFEYRGLNPIILAIPRGAVPIGQILAQKLRGQLDVVLVHKIGAPGNPEFAIGAITEGGEIFLGEQADYFSISRDYIDKAAKEELRKLKARRKLYSPYAATTSCRDRIVILVDDGIATGETMLAAVKSIRGEKPNEIVVAAPVASPSAYAKLERVADRMAVIEVPPDLQSVGQFYIKFPQVTDEEVVQILAHSQEEDVSATANSV